MLKLLSSPPQAISLTEPRGMEGSVLENVLDAIIDNLEQVLIGFWTGR
jgi:hypothetical protein